MSFCRTLLGFCGLVLALGFVADRDSAQAGPVDSPEEPAQHQKQDENEGENGDKNQDKNQGKNQDYEIRIEAQPSLALGSEGTISLHLNPMPRRSISADGPLKIAVSVAPAEGLTLQKRALRRTDASDPKATSLRFALGVNALKAGEYQVDFDIRFWVCGKRTCRPVREHREVSLTVSAPAGPPPPEETNPAQPD